MPEQILEGRRILVVEDEYLLAEDLRLDLQAAGAVIIGPVGTVKDALRAVAAAERIDGALLDINLGGEMVYPVGDLLSERGVPFVFTTGYNAGSVPDRFWHVRICGKPVDLVEPTAVLLARAFFGHWSSA